MNAIRNLRVTQNAGDFFTSWGPVYFPRRKLLLGVSKFQYSWAFSTDKKKCFILRQRWCWAYEARLWGIVGLKLTGEKPKYYEKNLFKSLLVHYKSHKDSLRIEPETPRSEAGNLVLISVLQTAAVGLQEKLNMYRNCQQNFMELFINLLFAEANPHTIIFLPSVMSTSWCAKAAN